MAAAGEGFGGIVVIAVVVVVVLGLVMVSPPGPHRGDVTLPTATPRLLAMVTTVPPCNTNIKKSSYPFFPCHKLVTYITPLQMSISSLHVAKQFHPLILN